MTLCARPARALGTPHSWFSPASYPGGRLESFTSRLEAGFLGRNLIPSRELPAFRSSRGDLVPGDPLAFRRVAGGTTWRRLDIQASPVPAHQVQARPRGTQRGNPAWGARGEGAREGGVSARLRCGIKKGGSGPSSALRPRPAWQPGPPAGARRPRAPPGPVAPWAPEAWPVALPVDAAQVGSAPGRTGWRVCPLPAAAGPLQVQPCPRHEADPEGAGPHSPAGGCSGLRSHHARPHPGGGHQRPPAHRHQGVPPGPERGRRARLRHVLAPVP